MRAQHLSHDYEGDAMLHVLGAVIFIIIAAVGLVMAAAAASSRWGGSEFAWLGDVIYWVATGIASLLAAFLAYAIVAEQPASFGIALLVGLAGVTWLVGRACRYVLAGR